MDDTRPNGNMDGCCRLSPVAPPADTVGTVFRTVLSTDRVGGHTRGLNANNWVTEVGGGGEEIERIE